MRLDAGSVWDGQSVWDAGDGQNMWDAGDGQSVWDAQVMLKDLRVLMLRVVMLEQVMLKDLRVVI